MRFLRKNKRFVRLFFILVLAGLAVLAAVPGGPDLKIEKPFKVEKKLEIKQGLDLQGGTHLVYTIDLSKTQDDKRTEAIESLRKVIQNRVDSFGVGEPLIQVAKGFDGSYKLIVELPGIKDVNQAINLIGKTAQLEFKEQADENNLKETGLKGDKLSRAEVTFDETTRKPQISIEFNEQGAKEFGEVTARNVGKPLAISLDEQIVSAPTVNEAITGGKAVITGEFTQEEAKNLAIQLNAGALPVPLDLVEQRTVGATLGQDAIKKSYYAGILGIILIVIFMSFMYRLPGVLASVALLIYTAIVVSVFKLFSVTMTLAGIAGLILSIGMAVDANILIFERMKEELRSGKSLKLALSRGYVRAWTSIRDSNVSSLITALILYTFGTGPIRGFAVVLSIGILISMFTAITITKNFMEITTSLKWFRSLKLYGIKKGEVKEE